MQLSRTNWLSVSGFLSDSQLLHRRDDNGHATTRKASCALDIVVSPKVTFVMCSRTCTSTLFEFLRNSRFRFECGFKTTVAMWTVTIPR